jgi:small subunit ribosomal protein S17
VIEEEEKNEETEETPQGSALDPAEADAPDTAQGSDPPEEEAPPAEEEAPAAEEEAAEPAADEGEAPAAEAEAEPEEELGPKQRRRRERSTHTGEARPQRSPEERAAERAEARKKKAAERTRWRKRSRERRRAQPKTEPLAGPEHGPGRARVRQGIVVSDKADKTITVRIDVTRRHRMYKKIVRESSTLHAHDERNEAHAGDTVRVIESRPLSRSKRWRLVEVVERAR